MKVEKLLGQPVVSEGDKADLKRLMAVFGVNGRKKPKSKPPVRTGNTKEERDVI